MFKGILALLICFYLIMKDYVHVSKSYVHVSKGYVCVSAAFYFRSSRGNFIRARQISTWPICPQLRANCTIFATYNILMSPTRGYVTKINCTLLNNIIIRACEKRKMYFLQFLPFFTNGSLDQKISIYELLYSKNHKVP